MNYILSRISTEEEYRKIMEKIPEYKVKPEKVNNVVFSLNISSF